VVGDSGLAQAERFCEVADAGLATVGGGDHRQQPDAVPVGQRAEQPGQTFGRVVVEYPAGYRRAASGQIAHSSPYSS
jgi:hypothetical protein